jgi:CheY-like chemotaxis protein
MATILIIDDNDTIREGLAITVKKLGHDPVTAANGAAGVAAFKLTIRSPPRTALPASPRSSNAAPTS